MRRAAILIMMMGVCGPLLAQGFEVASVRPSRAEEAADVNVPLTANDFYPPNHGVFSAKGIPLVNLIAFAYKLPTFEEKAMAEKAPAWVSDERFTVEARSKGEPTKDEMRGMMRALLAERFGLVVHKETRQVAELGMVPARAGQVGPAVHVAASCVEVPGQMSGCGGFGFAPGSGPAKRKIAGRDLTMAGVASAVSAVGGLGRPVVDGTGLAGKYDFTLEWTPEGQDGAVPEGGTSYVEAVREQLGMKLDAMKGPMEVVVIDKVERPGAN